MNLNFSIFRKLLSSAPAQAILGVLAFSFLFLQAYHLAPVSEDSQLVAVSIFGQFRVLPWWLCFLFEFVCIIGSLLIMVRINSNHRFVDRMSYPLAVFLFIGLTSHPQVLLHPEVLFSGFLGVLVVYLLLEIYNQSNISGIIFQSAVICSVASLFYLPSIILVVLILVGLSIFRPFELRSLLLILIGFALLYFYLFSLTYIFDWELNFPVNLNPQVGESILKLPNEKNFGLLGIVVLVIVSMGRLYSMRQRLIVRQRNQLAVMFIACMFYFGIGLFFGFSDTLLMLLSLSSIFFLFFYNSINKKWIVDSLLIIILIYNSFVTIFS